MGKEGVLQASDLHYCNTRLMDVTSTTMVAQRDAISRGT